MIQGGKMIEYVLLTLILISFVTDIHKRKIYNAVTLPVIASGFILNIIYAGFNGFILSGSGFLLGLALLFIPFLVGGIGAGDVKLFAAIGALKGPTFVFYTFLFTGIIGGIVAIIILFKQRRLKSSVKRIVFAVSLIKQDKDAINSIEKKDLSPSFPYGVPILLGTLSTLILGGF